MPNVLRWVVMILFFAVASGVSASEVADVIKDVRSEEPWTKHPTGFRGALFGSDEAGVQAVVGKLKCRGKASDPVRDCTPATAAQLMQIDGQRIRDTYRFREGVLVAVTLGEDWGTGWSADTIAPFTPGCDSVFTAFVQRYGVPSRYRITRHRGVKAKEVRTYGAVRSSRIEHVPYEYDRQEHEWENEHAYVRVAGTSQRCRATVQTSAERQREISESKQQQTTDF
jgi:hypothetical protein